MSSPAAISSAELQLAAALSRLSRVKGTQAEEGARQGLENARLALVAVREATHVVAARQCCGSPMTWSGRTWKCARGHE